MDSTVSIQSGSPHQHLTIHALVNDPLIAVVAAFCAHASGFGFDLVGFSFNRNQHDKCAGNDVPGEHSIAT